MSKGPKEDEQLTKVYYIQEMLSSKELRIRDQDLLNE